MGRMTDEDIGHLLRELPRDAGTPSSDFNARVLEKLDGRLRARRQPRRRRVFALGFVAAMVGAVLLTGGYLRERFERSKTAERVRELRSEYRDLQAELEKLRALTQEVQPVLELGGTDQVDFVLDLRELPRTRDSGERPPATPASQSSYRDDSRKNR